MSYDEDNIRRLILHAKRPLVFENFVNDWNLVKWNLGKWSTTFGDTALPFRHMKKGVSSKTPLWERNCNIKLITFRQFLQSVNSDNDDWLYFDYKYVHEWLPLDNDISKSISWEKFGFPDLGPQESTLWIGSRDAHTPAHQDTYGCNIVAQLHGSKRWILFPPEALGLKPTRIPYEESSVYSQLNFYCPKDLRPFNEIKDVYSVEVNKGDALFVPRGWWHYVVHTSDVAITLNTWLPVAEDDYSRLGESLVRLFVSQVCKDLPPDATQNLLNPNEDDVSEIPFVVSMRQVEITAMKCLKTATKNENQKVPIKDCKEIALPFDVDNFVSKANSIRYVPKICESDFYDLLGKCCDSRSDEGNGNESVNEALDKSSYIEHLINAFCQPDVMNMVRENFLKSLQRTYNTSNDCH